MTRPTVCIFLATGNMGGMGKALIQFLETPGRRAACDVTVVAYALDDSDETEFTAAVRATGTPLVFLQQRRRYDLSLLPQALRIIRERNCTVIESHGYKSHVVCACLHLLTGVPWVGFVHGWTAEDWRIKAYRLLDQAVLPLASRVVAVSASLKRQLWPLARRRCVVVPNAVDMAECHATEGRDIRAACGIPAGAPVVGVVGRLSPEKGQIHFLRALAEALPGTPGLHAILAGDGPDAASLRDEVRRAGLEGVVHFLGHVADPYSVYRALDVVVLPSLSEGMPLAALEAMACSRAVVGTRVGGVPEVVLDGETGLLVPPADPSAMARALTRLCGDAALRQQLAKNGNDRVLAVFTPAARLGGIMDVYGAVMRP